MTDTPENPDEEEVVQKGGVTESLLGKNSGVETTLTALGKHR